MSNKILKKLSQTRDRYKDIIQLKKAKEYNLIYEKYGSVIYQTTVPSIEREKDITNLMMSGRFEEIYKKHGADAFYLRMDQMKAIDKFYETGEKTKAYNKAEKNHELAMSIYNEKDPLKKFIKQMKRRIAAMALSATVLLGAGTPTVIATTEISRNLSVQKNALQYAEEIKTYDTRVKEYAQEVNSMNLSDIEIFMKVISDMWSEIDGYGTPEKDIYGFLRLDLGEGGVGVCRNMADDVTAKLNAINPEYTARNLIVYMDTNESLNLADIDRTVLETNPTVENGGQEESEIVSSVRTFVGNHAVTAVDVPGKNITLILDSTNPSIGVFKDGKIHMFSIDDGKGYNVAPAGQVIFGGFISMGDVLVTEVSSQLNTELSIEELEQEWGVAKQNSALEKLQKIKEKQMTFDEKYSVNIDIQKAISEKNENRERNSDDIER